MIVTYFIVIQRARFCHRLAPQEMTISNERYCEDGKFGFFMYARYSQIP